MTTQPQQASDAQSAGQAVATATPAPVVQTPTQIQPPPPAPQAEPRTFGMTDAEYIQQLRAESLKRKGKQKALKSEVVKTAAELAQTAKERDELKAAAAKTEAMLKQMNDRRAEDALIGKLRTAGFNDAAARLLIPSLRGHVVVDPKTFDITVNDEEITKAVAEIKPPQPNTAPASNGARLHTLNTAARIEQPAQQPTSWKDRLKAESQTLPK
jgi:hypothetical protein